MIVLIASRLAPGATSIGSLFAGRSLSGVYLHLCAHEDGMPASTGQWKIEMFGGLRVVTPSGEVVPLQPQQPTVLLAWIALSPRRPHSREELVELLWPEDDAIGAGSRRMRQNLYLLRRQLGPAAEPDKFLVATRQTIALGGSVSTDVEAFERAIAGARSAADPGERADRLAGALELYRGELLPGFYQEGILAERRRLAGVYAEALAQLALASEARGDLETAVKAARTLVGVEPLSEEAHCTLMRLYGELGQPTAVLRQYQALEKVLKEELGEEPSATTRQLMETLRERGAANIPATIPRQPPPIMEPPSADHGGLVPAGGDLLVPPRPLGVRMGRLHVVGAAILVIVLIAIAAVMLRVGFARHSARAAVAEGRPQWVVRCAPAQDEKPNSEPTAITTDADGNIYVAGFVQTLHNDVDMLVLKYSPAGTLVWRARYNGPGNDLDRAHAIAVGTDGAVYVAGDSDNGGGKGGGNHAGLDWAIVKLNAAGAIVWTARYNGPSDAEDSPAKICVDSDGSTVIAGFSSVLMPVGGSLAPRSDWTVMRLDPAGGQVWLKTEPLTDPAHPSRAVDMVMDADGNVYVTGWVIARYLKGVGAMKENVLTVKYAADGAVAWSKAYVGNGVGYCGPVAVRLDAAGDVYVGGQQYDGDPQNNGTLNDLFVVKYDAAGNYLWSQTFDNHGQDDTARTMTVAPNGDVCMVGNTVPMFESVFYDSAGRQLCSATYRGTAQAGGTALDSACWRGSCTVVAGYAGDVPRSHAPTLEGDVPMSIDSVTLLYDRTGREVWKGVCNPGSRFGGDGSFVAVDPQGSVIVTGQADDGSHNPVITVAKFAPPPAP